MAITLTSQLTDENLDPGSPTKFGTGNAPASETVIQLQGANCAAMGQSGTTGTATPVTADSQAANSSFRGMYSAVNIARDHNHAHLWIRDLYPIRNKSIGGVSVYLGNGTTQECLYYLTGLDDGYGGGWYHAVVNLSTVDRAAADLGTLPGANVNRLGYAGNISATKGESFLQNSYLDAIRYGADGVGITFTGGTSGAREDFAACVAADTASYGLLRSVSGALFCDGCLTIGSATSTTWIQDNLGGIRFSNFTTGPGTTAVVAADYYRIVLADATTGVTNLDLTDWVWNGASRDLPFRFTANLGTGDAYTSLRSSYIFGETITLNTLCTSDTDTFIECQTIVPSGITLTEPGFSNCDGVTLTVANDLVSGGSTALHNTAVDVSYMVTDDLEKITNHDFNNTGGTGHAIELTSGAISPYTYSFIGNTFTGYGTDGSSSAAFLNNSGADITINISGGGGTPTVTNVSPATTTINNTVSLTVNTITTVGTPIQGARVRVEADTGGSLPAKDVVTITRAGSTASVAHTGHGMPDGQKIIVRNANQPEYNKITTISNVTTNAYDYTVSGTPTTPATGTITSTAVVLEGLTDSSGSITDAGFNFTADQPVTGVARQSTATPLYRTAIIINTITSGGMSSTVTMILDE